MGSESWDANVTGLGPRDVPRSKEGRREGEWGGDNRGKNIIKYMYRKTLYKFMAFNIMLTPKKRVKHSTDKQ